MDPVGYELRTTTDGKGDGVHATLCFDIGETVMVGVIERRVDKNDAHATQVSRTEWVQHGGLGPKVNHSCSPNCGVRLNDSGACDFVAREPIAAGEEITFDYAMRNYSVEHFPAGCLCGSDICRGSVTGWKDLSDERKAAYRGLVAPYLLEIDRDARSAEKEQLRVSPPPGERDEGFAAVPEPQARDPLLGVRVSRGAPAQARIAQTHTHIGTDQVLAPFRHTRPS